METNENKSSFVKWITNLLNPNQQEVSTISAKEAYLNSLYFKSEISDEVRVNKFIRYIDNKISNKCRSQKFYCTIQVPEDLGKFKNKILKHFTENSYTCVDLSSKIDQIETKNLIYIEWCNKN